MSNEKEWKITPAISLRLDPQIKERIEKCVAKSDEYSSVSDYIRKAVETVLDGRLPEGMSPLDALAPRKLVKRVTRICNQVTTYKGVEDYAVKAIERQAKRSEYDLRPERRRRRKRA